MSYSDEQNKFQEENRKAIRALQILGFTFPPDMRRTEEQFEQLPVEHMLLMRRVYKEQFEPFIAMFEALHSRIQNGYCHICDNEFWAYDDIPSDWGWYDAGVGWYLMCDECQFRYAEKFNKIPEVVREPPIFKEAPYRE